LRTEFNRELLKPEYFTDSRALAGLLSAQALFLSWQYDLYYAPSEKRLDEQNPARASHESVKHSG